MILFAGLVLKAIPAYLLAGLQAATPPEPVTYNPIDLKKYPQAIIFIIVMLSIFAMLIYHSLCDQPLHIVARNISQLDKKP